MWPFGGLLFYLWYSHARPNDFVWPVYTFYNGAYLIAAATLLGYLVFEMHRSPPRTQGLKLIPVFWLWTALACILATNRDMAMPKIWEFAHIFVITFLVAAMANSERRIRALLYVLAFSIGFLGAKGAVDFVLTAGAARMLGPGGVSGEENEYALALNMAIPILLGLARLQPRYWPRWVLRGAALGCGITVIGTHSRSGLLGLALGALLLTFYSKRKVAGIAALALALVLFFKFAPSAAMERYQTIPNAAETDPSAMGRLQAWETALRMVKAHPFFGVGPLNFEETFPQYSDYPPRAPHNAFMSLLAESGIPACLLFVSIVGSTIVRMWWLRQKLQAYPENVELATYCLILQMTLMVYIVPNLFISRQNSDLMWHLVGVSSGLAWVAKRRLSEQRAHIKEDIQDVTALAEPLNA
jgi:probable O-glycosylation ligase (exosortase A-associated)